MSMDEDLRAEASAAAFEDRVRYNRICSPPWSRLRDIRLSGECPDCGALYEYNQAVDTCDWCGRNQQKEPE
uniref:Uncharacterized protein n=1 Tax=viral metagenome TaxID=1070528 RepID=A0A6M3L832_9ZZZZ